jgi:uncharacterized membrane protein
MLYLAFMVAALAVCALLLLIPSKRRLALRLCLAVLASLPGIFVFQFVIAVPLGVLVAAVLGFYAAFHPPEWVQWTVGIPTALIMYISFAAASLLGCYTGARIAWQTGRGTPFRAASAEQEIVRFVLSWFRKDRA